MSFMVFTGYNSLEMSCCGPKECQALFPDPASGRDGDSYLFKGVPGGISEAAGPGMANPVYFSRIRR